VDFILGSQALLSRVAVNQEGAEEPSFCMIYQQLACSDHYPILLGLNFSG
jgi:hypothetical protein